MYSYYGAWCPQCEKPEEKPTTYINLLQALYHVDRVCFGVMSQHDEPAGKQEMWSHLCDYNYIKNDTFVGINFGTMYSDAVKYETLSEDALAYLKAFVETFDLKEEGSVLWEISW